MALPSISRKLRDSVATLTPRRPYRYEDLNETNHEIRLMTLLPGSFSSHIRVELHKIRFLENHNEDFEALSYAWGSTNDQVDIFVGKNRRRTTQVTRNLAEALPYLRHRENPRVLWIDAICVNQHDLDERSSQVKRMPDVFSRASRVLVWLGPESNDSVLAKDCATTLSSNIKVDWVKYIMTPSSPDSDVIWSDQNVRLPFNDLQVQSICNLLNRNWFSRLWVWQEVHLARDVEVMCGSWSISWDVIRDTAYCIYKKPLPRVHESARLSDRHRRLLWNLCRYEGRLPLEHVISDTEDSLCSDPKDKIFAILSLLQVPPGIKLEPNYNKSTTEVYKDVMTQYINAGDVTLLGYVEMHEQIEDLPSWVPDWATARLAYPVEWQNPARGFLPNAKIVDFGTLQITGICVAHIQAVEVFSQGVPLSIFPDEEGIVEFRRVMRRFGFDSTSLPTRQVLLELCATLCCNTFEENFNQPPYSGLTKLESTAMALNQVLQLQLDEALADHHKNVSNEQDFLNRIVIHNCGGRCLFRSSEGHFGLAPQATKPGDIVTVVSGLQTALVLRPIGDNKFKVVGETYYHGVMNGEAILGQLPDHFKFIWRSNSETRLWSPAYLDQRTGNITGEDPRWPELPPSWRLVNREGNLLREEDMPLFVCEETGEETEFHPGLTRETLEKMGVQLEVFNLI